MPIQLTEHQAKYINPKALEWIEALKSGKYQQTQGQLATLDKFGHCCLGVAAEVCQWKYEPSAGSLRGLPYEQIGLYSPEGYPRWPSDGHALFKLNDDKGYSFDRIADRLLNYPEEYFIEISPELALQG